ncbi:MAG: elongation factor P [Bacillati bacterium ANGP1]|uniref:Elongation factor P n=1 Tax=Candidatus Segetimicrobium genomatis TaxID=2569760 RepID=A0A537JHP5_9BACT|nr:MAG: elongation factor P [Terrabacteria group bacterium ANGP1]
MISSNDFRPGVHVLLDGEVYVIVASEHSKVAMRHGLVRAKVRNTKTGATTERTFRGGERVPLVHLERKTMQYLYTTGDEYIVMDKTTFEQLSLPRALLGDAVRFLTENMDVTVVFHDETPIGVELPTAVDLRVTETAPGFRGDTVSGGSKPATLETGAVVQVPLFVTAGEVVRIDTRTGTYLERVR